MARRFRNEKISKSLYKMTKYRNSIIQRVTRCVVNTIGPVRISMFCFFGSMRLDMDLFLHILLLNRRNLSGRLFAWT